MSLDRIVRHVTIVLTLGAIPASGDPGDTRLDPMSTMSALAGKWNGAMHTYRRPNQFTRIDAGQHCDLRMPCNLTLEPISSNTALMERLFVGTPSEMVTLYHRDGDAMMATHYCSSGSQPRLRSDGPIRDPKKIVLRMLDATNVLDSNQMHIETLTWIIHDKDHFMQRWETHTDVTEIEFTREPTAPVTTTSAPVSAVTTR